MRGSKLGAAGCTGVVALALLANAELAFAQPTQAQQNALRSNCRSDFMANCSSVKPGGAEALQCLQRNVAKLSPGCQSAVAAVSPPPAATPPKAAAPASPPRPAATATPAAPAAPAAPAVAVTPPAATPPVAPTPRPQQPARTTTPAPAPPAAAATAKPTAQQQAAIKQSCQSDFMARCRGVQPGGADALRCLQRNAGQVSAGCRSALAAIGGAAPAPAKTATPAPAAAAAGTAAPAAMLTPQQQSAIRFTCRADFRTLCSGVPLGGPEALACLQRNTARLTPGCKTSIAAISDEQAATVAPAAGSAPAEARPGPGPLRRAIRERLLNQ